MWAVDSVQGEQGCSVCAEGGYGRSSVNDYGGPVGGTRLVAGSSAAQWGGGCAAAVVGGGSGRVSECRATESLCLSLCVFLWSPATQVPRPVG